MTAVVLCSPQILLKNRVLLHSRGFSSKKRAAGVRASVSESTIDRISLSISLYDVTNQPKHAVTSLRTLRTSHIITNLTNPSHRYERYEPVTSLRTLRTSHIVTNLTNQSYRHEPYEPVISSRTLRTSHIVTNLTNQQVRKGGGGVFKEKSEFH